MILCIVLFIIVVFLIVRVHRETCKEIDKKARELQRKQIRRWNAEDEEWFQRQLRAEQTFRDAAKMTM